jgi:hypothetical protein
VRRIVRIAVYHFWKGFQLEELYARFPCLALKYQLIADQEHPDLVVFSAFADNVRQDPMPTPPDRGVPTLFLTNESLAPDLTRCDFAITFRRDIDNPRHLRIPNWVQRLGYWGYSPDDLLCCRRSFGEPGNRFCGYLCRNRVPLREEFFRTLARRAPVDSPGLSMNNMPGIGHGTPAKLEFLRHRRFTIAFENESSDGYSTEKLPDAWLAGSVPLYWGDPLVALDFNPDAYLDLKNYRSLDEMADAVITLDVNTAAWQRKRGEPVYLNDTLPTCADPQRTLAFWETVLGEH